MRTLLTFARSTLDDCVLLEVHGEVDMSCAHLLDTAVRESPGDILVLDLTGVRFLSGAGVDVVLNAACRDGHATVVVVAPPACPAYRTLALAGVEATTTLYHSITDALTATRDVAW
ncbi:STAS domain-containing protein [Actinokineospora enzanensis]|uniref:STAS domain-containing protein n=1 Tax=Actinokineospora enzanensis TaxID=155975 RepID=UPI000366C4BC|nr:STAS domain-containing protein [Actinokineospora enzanensis]